MRGSRGGKIGAWAAIAPSLTYGDKLQEFILGFVPGLRSPRDGETYRPLVSPRIETVPLPLAQPAVRDGARYSSKSANRIFDAPRPLAFWHLASLDAPTVAVAWSLAFAWVSPIHLGIGVLVVMTLITWCAYVCDRLLDARVLDAQGGLRNAVRPALRERHLFHWRHRRLFVALAGVAACVAGVIALTFMPPLVRERGWFLAAAALIYFSCVHATPRLPRWLPRPATKEFLVGLLFTAGCILPAWSRLHSAGTLEFSHWWFWIAAVYFAALAWLNCSCIANWESDGEGCGVRVDDDRRMIFGPRMGRGASFSAALLLAIAGLLLAFAASASHPRSAALLVAGAVSALLLALLDHLRTRLTPLALRTGADLVLLTPLLLFLR